MRILVIEDESRMLELLRQGLYEHGYTVMTASDGVAGLEIASAYQFDVIVLDIGLPHLDGYGVIKELRGRGCVTPVLILTARDAEDDIIRGLDLGADDYVTKPFSFPELVLRLQSVTRPFREDREAMNGAGGLAVDFGRRSVTRDDRKIDLTRQEFMLLTALIRVPGQCVPRGRLMECIWGHNCAVGASTLDVLVNSLRGKIDGSFQTKLIGTVRGSGYLLRNAIDSRGNIEA